MERTPVIVLGMHRSGTSAVAHVIDLLGVPLGERDQLQVEWENAPLQEVNERVLRRAGRRWAIPPLGDDWLREPRVAELADDASSALHAAFDGGNAGAWAWKDPRLCLTLPFWRPLLPREPVIVLTFRHPLEVAASLTKRDHFERDHGVALWEIYTRAALRNAEGLPVVAVHYDELMADPATEVARLARALVELGVPFTPDGSVASAVASLERGQRHHQHTPDALAGALNAEQLSLYHAAQEVHGASNPFVAPALPPLAPATVALIEARAAWRLDPVHVRRRIRVRQVRRAALRFLDRLGVRSR
ncbi:MAG: Sulfotransferase family [Actinomycetia bacterium]|nr:Sulfotransferase family [Actinomycetes bacterium]